MSLCLWRPHISTALEYALQRGIPVNLTYEGRPRETGPVVCAVASTDRANTVLITAETFIPDELNGRDCRIYFKLGEEAEDEAGGEKSAGPKYGFYCRSYVQATRRNDDNTRSEIHIKTPFRALQRELRRHERLNVQPGMISKFCFWFAPGLPLQRGQVHTYMSRYSAELERGISLIDLSAGGAFVRLVNYELQNDIAIDGNTLVLLYIDCNGLEGESLKFFLAARCAAVFRSKKDDTLNLHLQFTRQLGRLLQNEALNWLPVGERGVSLLGQWIEARIKYLAGTAEHPPDFGPPPDAIPPSPK